ncbi:hypothetical protein MAP00_002783 [Monascus purpureus]|nr:hypothetical protein MAP00_002783 [Monascus purpureus]
MWNKFRQSTFISSPKTQRSDELKSRHTSEWTPVHLPYFRSELPAPLPTEQDILKSDTVFRHDDSYHRVVAVGPHFLVKHGRGVREREGQALLFLESHLNGAVSIPKLYAMYRIPTNGHLCLVMERIQGESLEAIWHMLGEDAKSTICSKIRTLFDTIRSVPSPGYYGSVDKGPVPHHLFHSPESDGTICGPFHSEYDFNKGLVKRLRSIWAANGRHSHKADFYERNLDSVFSNHKPVFSHSDLQRKNILVRRVSLETSSGLPTESFEVALIDWEDAGWYPCYWEYCVIFVAFNWQDDWLMRAEEILHPWPSEAAMLRMLYQDLWF